MLTYNHRKFNLKDNGRTDPFLTGRANPEKRKMIMLTMTPIPEGSKYCPGCEGVKEEKEFNKYKARKDGLAVYCRVCANGSQKLRRTL